MARTRLYALLESRINDEANKALSNMGDGACGDYGAYQYQCGYLRGLKEAVLIMDEIEKEKE